MKPTPANTALSINGVKTCDGALYFTNSDTQSFIRVPIDPNDGTATGSATILAQNVTGVDDFTLDYRGSAWLALDGANELGHLPAGTSQVQVVAGGVNSTALAGPTAARFGMGAGREAMNSYVSTTGGFPSYVSEHFAVGGGVVKVDVGGF